MEIHFFFSRQELNFSKIKASPPRILDCGPLHPMNLYMNFAEGKAQDSAGRRSPTVAGISLSNQFDQHVRPSMERDCEIPHRSLVSSSNHPPDSLFERCSWFYALCREYLFRDHTQEIVESLFPATGPRPGTHILELGCGPGFYACRLSQQYPQIRATGIDLSRRLIARAKSRAASRSLKNCMFLQGDAHSLPNPSNSVDSVIVSRLFLIVPGREAIVGEIFRVLRPGGRCFIAEPTSGFRTRIPLSCMWLLSKLSSSPAGKYREPRQADVMSRPDFAALVRSQRWAAIDLQYDGWYQYAVCCKNSVLDSSIAQEAIREDTGGPGRDEGSDRAKENRSPTWSTA